MTPAELRTIIARLGISQAAFATRIGKSRRAVEYWLSGKTKISQLAATAIRGME